MQGQRVFQQPLFVTVDINKLVPKNHLLRRVNRKIDFSFIYELTAPFYCSNNGRPSLDPELFLRMTVISYLYNVASDRQLCDEIGYNLAYRWFCKLSLADTVPDHCTLTVTRSRFDESGELAPPAKKIRHDHFSLLSIGYMANTFARSDQISKTFKIPLWASIPEEYRELFYRRAALRISNFCSFLSTCFTRCARCAAASCFRPDNT
ncbi:MAG: transposase [Deltaproteobacteria bacterium]|nr:transposase [Deltaproteobacteria bacterium]